MTRCARPVPPFEVNHAAEADRDAAERRAAEDLLCAPIVPPAALARILALDAQVRRERKRRAPRPGRRLKTTPREVRTATRLLKRRGPCPKTRWLRRARFTPPPPPTCIVCGQDLNGEESDIHESCADAHPDY